MHASSLSLDSQGKFSGLSCKFCWCFLLILPTLAKLLPCKLVGVWPLAQTGGVPMRIPSPWFYCYFLKIILHFYFLFKTLPSLFWSHLSVILLTTVMQTHHKSSSRNQGFCERQAKGRKLSPNLSTILIFRGAKDNLWRQRVFICGS